jgi:hypothetical protein
MGACGVVDVANQERETNDITIAYQLRTTPIGRDRRCNRYYRFANRNDRLFVEDVKKGTWGNTFFRSLSVLVLNIDSSSFFLKQVIMNQRLVYLVFKIGSIVMVNVNMLFVKRLSIVNGIWYTIVLIPFMIPKYFMIYKCPCCMTNV